MIPPWIVTQVLIGMAKFLPTMKLVPDKDLAEASFKDLKKREQVRLLYLEDNMEFF